MTWPCEDGYHTIGGERSWFPASVYPDKRSALIAACGLGLIADDDDWRRHMVRRVECRPAPFNGDPSGGVEEHRGSGVWFWRFDWDDSRVRMTLSEVFAGAAVLLEGDGAWTTGCSARSKSGTPTNPTNDAAVCWSITGALDYVIGGVMMPRDERQELLSRAWQFLGGMLGTYPPNFNDEDDRDQKSVIAMLRACARWTA